MRKQIEAKLANMKVAEMRKEAHRALEELEDGLLQDYGIGDDYDDPVLFETTIQLLEEMLKMEKLKLKRKWHNV